GRSRTYSSGRRPAGGMGAKTIDATMLPSSEIAGAVNSDAGKSLCVPSGVMLTRSVVGEQPGTATPLERQRSRTKTSGHVPGVEKAMKVLVSPATRFV